MSDLNSTLLTEPYGMVESRPPDVPQRLTCACRAVVGVLLCVAAILMSTVYVYTSVHTNLHQAEDVVKTMIAVNSNASPCKEPDSYFCHGNYPTPYAVYELKQHDTCPYIFHKTLERIDRVLNRYGYKLVAVSCDTQDPVYTVNETLVVVHPNFIKTILNGAHELSVLVYIVYPVLVGKGVGHDKAYEAVVADAAYSSLPLGTMYKRSAFLHTATAYYNCYKGTEVAKMC